MPALTLDGLPRLLRILDRQQVPASFFSPAASAVLHPKVISDIPGARQQHEIGVHGWIHERLPLLNNEKEEQRMLDLSIETLTKMTGKRPVGYRAPSWKHSGWTMRQIKAAGFLYDTSLMARDDAYELLLDGKPTGVVELPIERILDDSHGHVGAVPRGVIGRGRRGGVLSMLRLTDACDVLPARSTTLRVL